MNKVSRANEIQKQIAQWVFNHAPLNWGKFCIYIELLPNEFDVNDKFMENAYTIVWFDINKKELINIEIAGIDKVDMLNLFMDLNDTMAEINERWTTCKAKVTSEGKFSFDFGYDRPPRLKWETTDDLLYDPDYESF